jgi:hypothetical protein
MKINRLGKALLIFVAAYLVLLVVFSQFGLLYFKLFQGLFRWEIDAFFSPLKVTTLTLENYQGQDMISLQARLTENIILPDRTVLHTIGRPYAARTIAINQYLHPIIIFAILAAWPGIAWRDRFRVFLLVLPLLFLIELIDIPLLLAIRCEEVIQAELYQDPMAGKSLGSYWAAFLHTGGRAALSILAAGLALGCLYLLRLRRERSASGGTSSRIEPLRTKVGRNDPCPCGSGKKYKNCCGSK